MTNNASAAAHSPTVPTRIYKCNALTDIWTGSIKESPEGEIKIGWNERQQRNETKISENCLIPTGLLGSLRWWYEVLVRGLGGYACDPSAKQKECKDKDHCVVCELFGCTGWARKFAFAVLDGNGQIQQRKIAANSNFQLRFTELRPIRPEEWTLLDATLRLIADYGAIGGKTSSLREDYGLIEINEDQNGKSENLNTKRSNPQPIPQNKLQKYVTQFRPLKELSAQEKTRYEKEISWASLTNFWFVNKHLNLSSCRNLLSGLKDSQWLLGNRGISKKIFSFKNPARTFGFVKPGLIEFKDIKERLRKAWRDFSDDDFQDGEKILNTLLSQQ